MTREAPPRTWRYRSEVLAALAAHGVRPRPTTDPRLVFEFINDLYRYEIRRLRDRLIAGDYPKAAYAAQVVELRRRYPLVSVRVEQWVETPEQGPGARGEEQGMRGKG